MDESSGDERRHEVPKGRASRTQSDGDEKRCLWLRQCIIDSVFNLLAETDEIRQQTGTPRPVVLHLHEAHGRADAALSEERSVVESLPARGRPKAPLQRYAVAVREGLTER